jgi:membrane protease YdiL (CAAX protease family)
MRWRQSYFSATRHPWSCLLFLLPLLAVYEAGVLWLGGAKPEVLRNGADTWLRWGLEAFGLQQLYWPPALVVGLFLAWSWRERYYRPDNLLGVWTGMLVESILLSLGLWLLSRGLGPLLETVGIKLSAAGSADVMLVRLVTFVGAGIYEEVLFRLLLFSGLSWLLLRVHVPALFAFAFAAGVSATVFAAAHNLGPYGEPFHPYVFVFRTLAGLYFAVIYALRGFGIAVGAHAGYDVLVGVLVP